MKNALPLAFGRAVLEAVGQKVPKGSNLEAFELSDFIKAITPAAKAGLRKFDLITELAGQTVKSAADAQAIVDNSRVGQSLVCKVVRGQKTIAVAVTTSDLSDRPTK